MDAGIDNILIPYNIVGKPKLKRLTALVQRAQITVALDSEETATGISQQAIADGCVVPVIVELDTGSGRCGVQSPQKAQHLAQQIIKMQGIDFQGVMTYPSNVRAKPFIAETLDRLMSDGIPVTSSVAAGRAQRQHQKNSAVRRRVVALTSTKV